MSEELQNACRRLLAEGEVQVVIGYGRSRALEPPHPVFVSDPNGVEQLVWTPECRQNLVTYLMRDEVRALGKAAVVVKACDERAVNVLVQEAQLDRSQVLLVGVACESEKGTGEPKCRECAERVPRQADVLIGAAESGSEKQTPRFEELDAFLEQPTANRMAYWQQELARCTKCYACRQVCPLCYCRQCIVDKNRPVVIDGSPTLKGNFAWHITRAFHLAGRCVGCDQCTRACPAGIDLRLLNLSLARGAEEDFGYRPGEEVAAEPVIGAYRTEDQETFIR